MSVIDRIVRREKIPDLRLERLIVTGMVISTNFLQGIVPIYRTEGLKIPFAKTVAKWALEYFKKYQIAPGKHIEDIFKDQKDNIPDPEEANMIKDFLTDISNEYVREGKFNDAYILDKAEIHFRTLSVKNLIAEMEKALIGGKVEEAEAIAKGYERIARPQTQGVDPITDSKVIASALDEESGDKLFSLPGVLGKTIGAFERGWLFSFIGASGSGKSWWLMFTALRALFAGYNVVFISLEMSQKQMVRRIQHWVNALPTRKWAGELLIPVFDCFKNQDGSCRKAIRTGSVGLTSKEQSSFNANSNYKVCTACIGDDEFQLGTWYKKLTKKELTINQAINKAKAIKRASLIRGNSFKLTSFPSKSITMSGIDTYLYNLEHYEGFIPDVIVTDYADEILPEDTRLQYRHQIGSIWRAHKSLAQKRNCLVVTGSQSNTSRGGKDIKQGDWAESIEKLNLSDGGLALNMSPEEKAQGIMRGLIVKQRHDYFDLQQDVMVLHQLRLGRPYLDSHLTPKINKKEKKKRGE